MEERRSQPQGERGDLDALVRHVALAHGLLLAVIALYGLVAPRAALGPGLTAAMGVFAALTLALALPRLLPSRPTAKLAVQCWSAVALVTVVLWHTGGADSPLVSLYLLPIVLAALALPMAHVAALVAAIACGFVATAALRSGVDVASPDFAARFGIAIGPFVVVAWLTSQLGGAVLAARRQASARSDLDPPSGLAREAEFDDALERERLLAERRALPYAVLVLEIEGLAALRERFGEDGVDAARLLVGSVLRRSLRDTDVAARRADDTFVVLLPGADLRAANATGQRVRNSVQATSLTVGGRTVRCTVLAGAAAGPARDGGEPRDLVAQAAGRLREERESRRAELERALAG